MRQLAKSGLTQILIVGVILGLIVAACGGSDPTAAPVAKPTAAPKAVAEATAVPAAEEKAKATAVPKAKPAAKPAAKPTAVPVQPTAAPKPKRGGILTKRVLRPWPIRDTWDKRGQYSTQVSEPMLSNLVVANPYNNEVADEVIGDVAKSWTVSGDGTVYTFKLNSPVYWHDGEKLTADDVVWTLDRGVLNPPSVPLASLRTQLAALESVTATDETTVVAKLNRPSNAFLTGLATNFANIMPKHHGDDMKAWNKTIIGSGPFVLGEEAKQAFKLKRNDNYFRPGLPYLDGVEMFIIGDPAMGMAAFRTKKIITGSIVFDNSFMVEQANVIRKQFPNIQEQNYLGGRIDLNFNNRGPLSDRRVRQAISMGIDRQAFNEAWADGKGEILASAVVPNSLGGRFGLPPDEMRKLPGFNPDNAEADRDAAIALLNEAGLGGGFKLEMQAPNHPRYSRGGEIVQSLLSTMGIDAVFTPKGRADMTPDRLAGRFDIDWNSATLLSMNPLDSPGRAVVTGGSENYGHWSFFKVDQLLEEQDKTLDETKRRQVLHELQRELLETANLVSLLWWTGPVFWQPELRNFPRCFLGHSSCYTWEQVWMDN